MELLSCIALAMTPGLGPGSCRRLLDAYPGEDPFSLPPSEIRNAFGSHRAIADAIVGRTMFARAEEELRFCEQQNIRVVFCTDEDYPQRLNREETEDCPALIYVHGDFNLNPKRSVSIVGTRRATPQGRDNTDRLVRQLAPLKTPIISGLAYGIDTAAHVAALGHGLPTVAVLGHGLDRIYPSANRRLAEDIMSHGGALVTEYPSYTDINPRHFPARNRIIAALADAVVVVEASEKGGALITAAIAHSYHREVFAVPGRLADTYSVGTNNLIATRRALLLRDADDLAYQMGWPLPVKNDSLAVQQSLFPTLSHDEQLVFDLLREHGCLSFSEFLTHTSLSQPALAAVLFNLEMQKLIHALPGRLYQMVQ